MICLQHFLFDSEQLPVKTMWIEADEGCVPTPEGMTGTFPMQPPGKVTFDGIGNAFPIEPFAYNTSVSEVKLTGEFDGEISIEIWHAWRNGKTVIYEEGFQKRKGRWESQWIPLSPGEGRFFLSIHARGKFSIQHLQWEGNVPSLKVEPHFLVSVTTYKREEFLIQLIHSLCNDVSLKSLNISFLIVDNGETIERKQLPEDPRLTLFSQANLGGTGGAMRGLRFARSIKAAYMIISDDDIVMPPETLYRMLILQTLSNRPLAVGALMLTLDDPFTVVEQGGLIPNTPLSGTTMIHNGRQINNLLTLHDLYEKKNCDYSGWWLLSANVTSLNFLPPFFLHWDDVLQGLLLKKQGTSVVVPASIFLWHVNLRPKNIPVWKRYVGLRNGLSTHFINSNRLSPFQITRAFFQSIHRFLISFDYELAEYYLLAFRDASCGSKWTHHPLEESDRVRALMKAGPIRTDLSGRLSLSYSASLDRKSLWSDRLRKITYYLSIAGYLFPFSRKTAPNGGLAFRTDGNYDAWNWTGYQQIAVVDTEGRGYICQRSWRKAGSLLMNTLLLSIRFLLTHKSVSNAYRKSTSLWEENWNAAFAKIEGGKVKHLDD